MQNRLVSDNTFYADALRKKKLRKATSITYAVLSNVFLIILALMIVVPFLQLILSSLKSSKEVYLMTWFPTEVHFENYLTVFRETVMLKSFYNTFTFIVPTVVVGTLSSALCAYGFARLRFPGKNIVFSLMMATLVIPNIIIMIPAYVMFANFYDWVGSALPVVIPGMFGSTVTMFFLLQFIRTLPRGFEEAALIDGLGRGGIFTKIILPLTKPAIITQLLLGFVGMYNDYLTPLLYLGGNTDLFTIQLAINQMNSAYAVEMENLLAACVIALIPTVVLFLSSQKYFVDGIAMGGLKG